MSEGCTHDCSTCSSKCSEKDLRVPCGQFSNVKKVIGVVSGKGGVGKSLVTSLLASAMQARGHATAIMDADVTGPSIPKSFGLHGNAVGDERGLLPMESKTGIKIMSVNLLLEKEDAPVVWRGPVIAGVIQQFWSEVVWGDVDYMFVDMPPGTGDIHISLLQEIPVEGAVVVTTPQAVALADVEKGVNMFRNPGVQRPVFGIVENMAWFTPAEHPEEKYYIFGTDGGAKMAEELGVELLGRITLVQSIRESGDQGEPAAIGTGPDGAAFIELAAKLAEKLS